MNNFSKWRLDGTREAIISAASNELFKRMLTLPSGKRSKSPVAQMELILMSKIKEHRKRGRKVSRRWICINSKKIQCDLDVKDGTELSTWFKASAGWFHRFLKRNHVKFRKRKSGKKNSTDDNMEKILHFFAYLRYKVLPEREGENLDQFTEKWGRYPPHLRYNTDQVPLPFVISQESTYTNQEDSDVHIAGHGKGDLRKRQFTMHIYVNAGVGDQRDGYIELICKGKVLLGGRFSPAERTAWDERVNMYFQKNAWMDREVMAVSAKNFNDHIKDRWGENAKALLTADNLDAHVYHRTREILAEDGRVFALFFPPSCTEAIQPIDAGHGRSIRCTIGRLLDDWLMEADNLEIWERGMTAGERRVLISKFVAIANEDAMGKDDSRVSCFRRCGVLLTLDGTMDDLIKPQGCTKLPIKIPDHIDFTTEENFNNPHEVIQPETVELGTTDEDMAIHIGDEEDQIGEGMLVVDEDDFDIDEQTTFSSDDEELGSIASESIETRNPEGNETVWVTARGRRIRLKRRFACEGY